MPVLAGREVPGLGKLAMGHRLAPSESADGAAQGAQPLPEPQLGLAGICWVMWHALPAPKVGMVQHHRLAEADKDEESCQEEEDADKHDDDGQGVYHLGGSGTGWDQLSG